MAIRKIARMGNPILRQRARLVRPEEVGTPELNRLIDDMIDTMRDANGIGLAAPQVHESIRLAIIGFDEASSRYPDMGKMPLEVLINPQVTILDPTPQAYWEGCLSIPEIRAKVERPRKIKVEWLDQDASSLSIEAEGFLATVFQHELDHLDGVLFVDRMRAVPGHTPIAFTAEYARYDLARLDEDADGELED